MAESAVVGVPVVPQAYSRVAQEPDDDGATLRVCAELYERAAVDESGQRYLWLHRWSAVRRLQYERPLRCIAGFSGVAGLVVVLWAVARVQPFMRAGNATRSAVDYGPGDSGVPMCAKAALCVMAVAVVSAVVPWCWSSFLSDPIEHAHVAEEGLPSLFGVHVEANGCIYSADGALLISEKADSCARCDAEELPSIRSWSGFIVVSALLWVFALALTAVTVLSMYSAHQSAAKKKSKHKAVVSFEGGFFLAILTLVLTVVVPVCYTFMLVWLLRSAGTSTPKCQRLRIVLRDTVVLTAQACVAPTARAAHRTSAGVAAEEAGPYHAASYCPREAAS